MPRQRVLELEVLVVMVETQGCKCHTYRDIVTSKSLIKSSSDMSGSYGLVASSQGGSGGLGGIISGALQLASKE